MKKIILLSASFLVIGFTSAQAQTDWFAVAKSVLNNQTTKTTSSTSSSSYSSLTNDQIANGLKEALNIGTKQVVSQLGKTGGFNLDPKIRIPLPPTLARADKALKAVGFGSLTTDLESRMNKAAEIATPKAQQLFINSIKQMTVTDARDILSSKQDAATQYLRKTMGEELAVEMKPIIGTALADAGAIKAYDQVVGKYATLPLVSSAKTNLNDYVVGKAMDGIFYYVAQEEAAIRQNPAKRTTDLLKTVFGAKK